MPDPKQPPEQPVQPLEVEALTVPKKPTTADMELEVRAQGVGDLLTTAYRSASQLQLTEAESKGLRAPFDDSCVRTGAKGDDRLLYISHIFVSDRLNDVLGIGTWALIKRTQRAEETKTADGKRLVRIYYEGCLLIRGVFITEAIGVGNYHPHNPKEDYGSALESAMSDCLTRCCKRLGIGSQTWDKGYCEQWLLKHKGKTANIPPPRPAHHTDASKPAPKPAPASEDITRHEPAEIGDVPEGCTRVITNITNIVERKLKYKEDAKDGSYKKGDEYPMWKVETENDGVFSTFSMTHAATAKSLKDKQEFATIDYKESNGYNNIVGIC